MVRYSNRNRILYHEKPVSNNIVSFSTDKKFSALPYFPSSLLTLVSPTFFSLLSLWPFEPPRTKELLYSNLNQQIVSETRIVHLWKLFSKISLLKDELKSWKIVLDWPFVDSLQRLFGLTINPNIPRGFGTLKRSSSKRYYNTRPCKTVVSSKGWSTFSLTPGL